MADTLHLPDDDTGTAIGRVGVRVRGAVQGVGFRPFIWTLAGRYGLAGWVRNDSDGVEAELEGPTPAIEGFLDALSEDAPPLARIDSVEHRALPPRGDTAFEIRQSREGALARTSITADAATCDACLEDMFDPANRRHGYAFTNCTHCGPRYTITHRLP